MKKVQKIKQDGYGRRLVKQLLSRWMKRKNCRCQKGIDKILENIEDMQGSIEIMAREMARKAAKDAGINNLRS